MLQLKTLRIAFFTAFSGLIPANSEVWEAFAQRSSITRRRRIILRYAVVVSIMPPRTPSFLVPANGILGYRVVVLRCFQSFICIQNSGGFADVYHFFV